MECRCQRCDYRWKPRVYVSGKPNVCPSCKSPYWNKEKKLHYNWRAKHRKLVKV